MKEKSKALMKFKEFKKKIEKEVGAKFNACVLTTGNNTREKSLLNFYKLIA